MNGSPRRTYENSCEELQRLGYLDAGPIPVLPSRRPSPYDDDRVGVRFFRTQLTALTLTNLTLPRSFFGRSEVRDVSFKNTDLSESTLCWNDFIAVDFTDSDLCGSDLRAALFEGVNFTGANLSETDLRRSEFRGCVFLGANFQNAKLTEVQRSNLQLSSRQDQQVNWQDMDGEEPEGG